MPDENSHAALKALSFAARDGLIVPSHFWQEVRNVFLVNERRGRLTQVGTSKGLTLVAGIHPTVDDASEHMAVLEIARRHNLTSYDAAYLELALRRGLPLATLDKKLAKSALTEELEVVSDFV